MKSTQFWFGKIIDTMTTLELRDFRPQLLYIHSSIIKDLEKEYGQCKKGLFSITHFMGMKIKHTSLIRQFKIVDTTKHPENFEMIK